MRDPEDTERKREDKLRADNGIKYKVMHSSPEEEDNSCNGCMNNARNSGRRINIEVKAVLEASLQFEYAA